MRAEKGMDLIAKLNEIQLKNCEGIQVGHVCYYRWIDAATFKSGVGSFLKILIRNFKSNYQYKIVGHPQVLMFFSNSYRGRTDHLNSFNKVCQTCKSYVSAIAGKFCKAKNLHTLGLIFIWYRQLRPLNIRMTSKWCVINAVHEGYCDYERLVDYLEKENIKIKYIVSVCDVMSVDSFVIQKFNMMGIGTVTLQHGTFNKGDHVYSGSISTYFLAHSRFSKENAIESGIDPRRVFIVGAPQNIGAAKKLERTHRKRIGLFLGGYGREQYNNELLDMVKKYARNNNYKIYVKFHPSSGPARYTSKFLNYIDKSFTSEISVSQFMDMVDFTVDNGSTVFVESIMRNIICFSYICPYNAYGYNDKIKLTFKTYNEMEKLFRLYEDDIEKLEEMLLINKDYLATARAPYDLYSEFFERLMRGDTDETESIGE